MANTPNCNHNPDGTHLILLRFLNNTGLNTYTYIWNVFLCFRPGVFNFIECEPPLGKGKEDQAPPPPPPTYPTQVFCVHGMMFHKQLIAQYMF